MRRRRGRAGAWAVAASGVGKAMLTCAGNQPEGPDFQEDRPGFALEQLPRGFRPAYCPGTIAV